MALRKLRLGLVQAKSQLSLAGDPSFRVSHLPARWRFASEHRQFNLARHDMQQRAQRYASSFREFPKSGASADIRFEADPVYEAFADPAWIAAAVDVMGSIDLDPFSTPEANEHVRATKFYTKEENGLRLQWAGNIWMNPPWGDVANSHLNGLYDGEDVLLASIGKLVEEVDTGRIDQAIVVFPGNRRNCPLRTRAWNLLTNMDQLPATFVGPLGEARFMRPQKWGGEWWIYPRGIYFVYIGNHQRKFENRFSRWGPGGQSNATAESK